MNAKMGEQQKEKYEIDHCISDNALFTHKWLSFNHSGLWMVVPLTGKCCKKNQQIASSHKENALLSELLLNFSPQDRMMKEHSK